MIFKKGELFSGPGGLAVGAKIANEEYPDKEYKIIHTWANDIDESACETFKENIAKDTLNSVYHCPVQELKIEELAPIDALTFGFPCNDFSIVGEQKGFDGNYGPLYSYGVKALNIHKPLWFIAENVGGLQSANDGVAFKTIIKHLKDEGYELTPHLYKFEEYGVPQTRHRILIVGLRKDLGLRFEVPAPITENPISAKVALTEPPIPNDALNNELTQHKKKVIEMLSHIPPGENAWYEGVPEELRLNVKGAKLSQIYKRLNPDKPAYTVTGSGGGGTHVYHYEELRALTNRERARLQTFPDDFYFKGGKEKVRQQIGMAVPPRGIAEIYKAIFNTFKGVKYPSISAKWGD